MKTKLGFGALALVLLSSTALSAAEIPLQTKIDSVTVYADGASVTRLGDLKTPPGQHVLVLSGLPENVDPDTIRLSGEGLDALIINSVDARIAPGAAVDQSAYTTKREALNDQLEAARGELESLTAQKNSMLKFSNALPNQLSGEKSALEIEKWSTAWKTIGTGIAAINKDIKATNDTMKRIDAEIAALDNAQQTEPDPGQPKRDIIVNVEASAEITGRLSIAYQTYGASWRPVYDARLVTTGDAPEIELTRRAALSQTTGEDWTDVALSLATVSLNRNSAAPRLDTLAVSIFQPEEAVARMELGGTLAQDNAVRLPAARAKMLNKAAPAPVAEPSAQVDLTAYQANFSIRERVTLATDGVQKTVLIGKSTEKPELVIRSVPALDPTAYLEARFANGSDAPLLPGTINLRRDDTFIGRGSLELTPSGEKVALGFGADDLVKITRVPVRKRENDPNPTGTKTSQEDYRTSVKNLHDFAVKVTVQDRLPVSENSAITVEALPTNTAPTEKVVEQRRGVSAWTFDLAPQENKDIRFGWRLKYPADRSLNWINTAN